MDGGGWDGSGREWAGVERGVEKWRSGEGRRGGDDGKWWWVVVGWKVVGWWWLRWRANRGGAVKFGRSGGNLED